MPGSDEIQAKPNPYQDLDYIREVAFDPEQRHKLFVRALVPDPYLILLSEVGVLRARGKIETNCRIDFETGEQLCLSRVQEPAEDCRLPSCPYAAIMRMRLITRLRAAYALERKKCVGL